MIHGIKPTRSMCRGRNVRFPFRGVLFGVISNILQGSDDFEFIHENNLFVCSENIMTIWEAMTAMDIVTLAVSQAPPRLREDFDQDVNFQSIARSSRKKFNQREIWISWNQILLIQNFDVLPTRPDIWPLFRSWQSTKSWHWRAANRATVSTYMLSELEKLRPSLPDRKTCTCGLLWEYLSIIMFSNITEHISNGYLEFEQILYYEVSFSRPMNFLAQPSLKK